MHAEHLREWLQEHQKTEAAAEAEAEGETSDTEDRERGTDERIEDGGEVKEPTKWEMVVELLQTAFQDGVLAEEATWQAVVLILEGGGDYHGIGLVEVVWKAVAKILNFRFTASINYHNSLHGFRAGRSTGTATLEVKLIHQVSAMMEAVIHTIFLDLHKAYDALDRSRYLDTLEGYGVGHRALHLLRRYWEQL